MTSDIDRWYSGYPHNTDSWDLTGFVVESPDFSGSYGIDFGTSYLNNPIQRTAVLKNSGSLTLTINGIAITDTDSARFQTISGAYSGTLSPGATRDIEIKYLADIVGIHNANIRVDFTYDGLSNYINLPLMGETVSAPAAQLWLEDVFKTVEFV